LVGNFNETLSLSEPPDAMAGEATVVSSVSDVVIVLSVER
jgi:hypothetical protein